MKYTVVENNLNFSEAIRKILERHYVQRKGWNGKNMFLYESNFNCIPIIAIQLPNGTQYPWTPSQQDMFANDWQVIEVD